MSELGIAYVLLNLLQNFLLGIGSFVIDLILSFISFMPTDPFTGLLDVVNEPFFAYMPYINWFIPIDYLVILIGSVLDAYALMIVFKYVKKILHSLLNSQGSMLKVLGFLFS